jgi:hypothetical protein
MFRYQLLPLTLFRSSLFGILAALGALATELVLLAVADIASSSPSLATPSVPNLPSYGPGLLLLLALAEEAFKYALIRRRTTLAASSQAWPLATSLAFGAGFAGTETFLFLSFSSPGSGSVVSLGSMAAIHLATSLILGYASVPSGRTLVGPLGLAAAVSIHVLYNFSVLYRHPFLPATVPFAALFASVIFWKTFPPDPVRRNAQGAGR